MIFPEQIIVAGTDGSPGADPAIRWAAEEAQRRGATLILLHAFDAKWVTDRNLAEPQVLDLARSRAEEIAANAELVARQVAPTATIRREVVRGAPVSEILRAAETAVLIVVGNRGHGGFTSLLLGSVGQGLATHARCPVVVVSGRHVTPDGPVVVGVDGSASGTHPVELAFDQAAARGCPLVALHAFRRPAPPWAPDIAPSILKLEENIAAERGTLRELLDPWRDKYPEVEVHEVISRQEAAHALLDASRTARLVVVGSSVPGSLTGTVLGSVGLHLLHQADCPVMIAR
jgi:nucleotide-binding universal stress UspA family protein